MKTKLSTFTGIVSLLVLGITVFAVFNIFSFSSRLKEKVEIVVYLKNSADTVTLQKDITAIKEIKKVKFVSKEESLSVFKKEMEKDADIFSILKLNPLPDSFRIRIKPSFVTMDKFEKVSEELKGLPGIDEVRYEKEFLRRFSRLINIAELIGVIGCGVIAGYVILVLFTIRRFKTII